MANAAQNGHFNKNNVTFGVGVCNTLAGTTADGRSFR
jgi:hypothetical protein